MPDLPNLAFIGKAGAGKDTAAELLIEQLGYRRVAFADKLKDVAETLWGPDARKSRCHLQKLGEYVRQIDEDTWVNLALADLARERGVLRHVEFLPAGRPLMGETVSTVEGTVHPVIVTDCRYHNEAWTLKGENFVIVRIVAERTERINRLRTNGKLGSGDWESHISETDLDEWPQDYTVQNIGSKADLLDDLARVIALDTGSTAPR
jgi:dephospho-CoA kinase